MKIAFMHKYTETIHSTVGRNKNETAYPRRILLAVTGLSPQVITETIYALAVARSEPWTPTEVHLITTSEGATRARLALLSEDPAWFKRLLKDYDLPPMDFDENHIHVLKNGQNQKLDDIRHPEDNEYAADMITERVREFTSDPRSSLHVSIAGGRKTMGYYLGYALSLFGRPQDSLSHVLVSEPFESSWNFFYPTPYSQVIETRDKALADTRDATVTLAEIPFVSMREDLPTRLQQGKASFSETVAAAQKAQQPPKLEIHLSARHINASGEPVPMSPADLAFYAMMARCRVNGLPPQNHRSEDLSARYLAEYVGIVGKHSGEYERTEKALTSDDLKEWFEQRKSKTNKALREKLGEHLAKTYQIKATGRRPQTHYFLDLPVESIQFADGKLAGGESENKTGLHSQNKPEKESDSSRTKAK